MISISSSAASMNVNRHAFLHNGQGCKSKQILQYAHPEMFQAAKARPKTIRDACDEENATSMNTLSKEDVVKSEPQFTWYTMDARDDSDLSSASSHGTSGVKDKRSRQGYTKSCPSMKSLHTIEELIRGAFDNIEQMNSSSLAAFWNQASCLLQQYRKKTIHEVESKLQHKVRSLYELTRRRLVEFRPIHITQTLHAMGNIVRNVRTASCHQTFFYDLLVKNGVTSEDSIFREFVPVIVRRLEEFGTRALALIAMTFARIDMLPEFNDGTNLFDHIAHRACRSISYFNAQGLSNLAWSFAKANQHSPQLFELIAKASERCMAEFSPQDISIMLWAFTRVTHAGEHDTRLFKMLAERAMSCSSDFKSQELASTVHAFATVKRQNYKLFKMIGDEAVVQIESFSPQNLSKIVWAYATAGVPHPRLFDEAAKKASGCLSEFVSQDLSNTAWAFATAKVYNPHFFEAIAEEALAKLREFEPQHLSNIVWAYATLKLPHERLFTEVADAVLRRRTEFISQQVSSLIWSYAYVCVGSVNQRLYSLLESIVILSIDDCDSQFLANVAWSYAVANVDAPFLFRNRSAFINAILTRQDEFNLRELCQLHQWILWQKEMRPEFVVQSSFQELCYKAYTERLPNPSTFQDEVMLELKSIGLDPIEEYRLAVCGYILDAIVEIDGEKIGIEVDGPSHFAGRQPLGKLILKQRQVFNVEGLRVVSVPYWEWRGSVNKQEYLRSKLGMDLMRI
ncbi:hypothetical protein ACHAWX_007500 [Stephanocyclus meneghinianus]